MKQKRGVVQNPPRHPSSSAVELNPLEQPLRSPEAQHERRESESSDPDRAFGDREPEEARFLRFSLGAKKVGGSAVSLSSSSHAGDGVSSGDKSSASV